MNAVFKISTTTNDTWETTERFLNVSEAKDFVKECNYKPLIGELMSGQTSTFTFHNLDGAHRVTYGGDE
tara:strand:- start:972 stop:1178 length:207 start_codon:yes stop_codon:yes gene_type:complete